MPPKPFKAPRPSTSKPSTSKIRKSMGSTTDNTTPKARGRPKGTTGISLKDKPSTSSSKSKKSTTSSKAASRTSLSFNRSATNQSDHSEEDEDEDPFASSPPSRNLPSPDEVEEEEENIQEVQLEEDDEDRVKIPEELLRRCLHEFFKEDGTRIGKDASKAVGMYMDTFVREAVARVAFGREDGDGAGGGGVGGFWEVEDLEKQAPQMLLDF